MHEYELLQSNHFIKNDSPNLWKTAFLKSATSVELLIQNS